MNELLNIEVEKLKELVLVSEDQRKELVESAKYLPIPYMPISKNFIQKYILNNTEYPLIESKLSQAATEMKSRLNQIVQANYDYNKALLDIQELDVEIEEIDQDVKKSLKRKEVEINKKSLDKKMKLYTVNSIKINLEQLFKEFVNWKQTVEDCLSVIKEQCPNIKTIEEIPYEEIRMAEMQIKIDRWNKMDKAGMDLTPGQKIFVENEKMNVDSKKAIEAKEKPI